MSLLRLILLSILLSIHSEGASACAVPPYSMPLHEVNLTTENEALLLTEGRCYLRCVSTRRYRSVITRDETTYEGWPFPIVDDSNCEKQQQIHECTRGCKYLILNLTATPRTVDSDINPCIEGCLNECQEECGGMETCSNPDTIDLWVTRSGCTNVCNKRVDCHWGCLRGKEIITDRSSVPPTPALSPPVLTPLDSRPVDTYRAGIYSVNLTATMSSLDITMIPFVGFLFRIIDTSSENITYIWQRDPTDELDLSSHACREVKVSLAIVNSGGQSNFSDSRLLRVYGDSAMIPNPVGSINLMKVKEDTRIGFFQHAIMNISWEGPEVDQFLDSYLVLVKNLNEDEERCGVSPLSMAVPHSSDIEVYSVTMEANSTDSLPVMDCTYLVTVFSVSMEGNRSVSEKFIIPELDMTDYVSITCNREWEVDMRNNLHFSFNLLWEVQPNLAYGDYISNYTIVTEKVISVSTSSRGGDVDTVVEDSMMNQSINAVTNTSQYNKTIGEISRFYRPSSTLNLFFKFKLMINWNASNLFFTPPPFLYTCKVDASSPPPSEVQNFTIRSFDFLSIGEVKINAMWSPPLEVNGALGNYTMCIGRSPLMDDQEPNEHSICRNITSNLTAFDGEFLFTKSSEDVNLYLQIRARNFFVAGNWTDPQIIPLNLQDGQVRSGLGNGEVLGITFGAIFVVVALVTCLVCICVCFKMLRRRKKLWRITQTTANYDPMFGVSLGPSRTNTTLQSNNVPDISFDDWELLPTDIVVDKSLGEGAFGEVYKGLLKGPITCSKIKPCFRNAVAVNVAIKLLKDTAKGSERKDFLSEIEMMKKISEGHSPHVVAMLGCVTSQEPLCLVTEFIHYGDLLSYLRSSRKRHVTGTASEDEDPYLELGKMAPVDLLSFAYQIAAGMAYLSSIGIVHRDLACRNILVDEGKVLKITDFGMSRETEEIYIQQSKGRVPFKWMAIESIIAREFTSASDVWSYGIILWEIGTLGGVPYPGVPNEELLPLLKRGYRMEKPENCSSEMYEIMLSCWTEEPTKRLTFKELQTKFDSMLSAEGNNPYIDFSINPDKLCYTAEVDEEADLIPNNFSHVPSPAANRKSLQLSELRATRSGSTHSSSRSLLHDSPAKSRSASPMSEKLHAVNLLSFHNAEKDDLQRPHSMVLPQNRDSEEDRYVKDPSLLAEMAQASSSHVTATTNGRRRGSDGAINMSSAQNNFDGGSHKLVLMMQPPEIKVTEN